MRALSLRWSQSLIFTPHLDGNRWKIRVHSDGEFKLKLNLDGRQETHLVKKGDNAFATSLP